MTPRLSIIVPLFNAQATVRCAVRSALRCSDRPLEVIVVNDGSTDRGPQIVREMIASDSAIRMLDQSNAGLGAARNAGLRAARGRWIVFLDADDNLHELAMNRVVDTCEREGARAACASIDLADEGLHPLGFSASAPAPWLTHADLLVGNPLPVHGYVLSAGVLRGHTFDESLASLEDHDLWLRLAAAGVRWRRVRHTIGAYRLTEASMSSDYACMARAAACVTSRAFRRMSEHERPVDWKRTRDAIIARHALKYATRCAIAGGSQDASARAMAIIEQSGCASVPDPGVAARIIASEIPFALRISPRSMFERSSEWIGDVRAWIGALSRAGCLGGEASAVDKCMRHLAQNAVDAGIIAEAIVTRIEGAGPVVLLGWGANARRLAPVLEAEGMCLRAVVDDAPGELEPVAGRLAPPRRMTRAELPAHDGPVVMTVDDDSAFIESLPRGVCPVRWADVRHDLARGLLESWGGRTPRAATGAWC